ncbi:MAG: DegT/DnrJ/EryC1/StrS family aminotransferase, partial [Gluconacetobacter diazotrophicus]|nr:DegT/DnrJ/EryC1/StrS family aminotransferase [Gluconacetobacter diazotrophicus]
SADPDAEEALIARYGERIAVIIPYATFGTAIDLERYAALGRRTGIPVVVDAATSLGSMDALGRQFGSGSSLPIVFSMHATKTFATAEGGVVFSADPVLVDRIRSMANFGFEIPRTTSLPGLNAKLSEVHAVLARARLRGFDAVMQRRQRLDERYRERLPDWQFQEETGRRSGCSFLSVLLPRREYRDRAEIVAELHHRGIGTAAYFSPHLGQQPFFAACPRGPLPVADEIAARVLCLPIWDGLEADAVDTVCDTLREVVACSTLFRPYPQFPGVRA